VNITIKSFIKKEFLQALRDPRMRMLIFAMPIIQLVVFGVAISTEVKNIRLGVVASNRDYEIRNIYDHALSSGNFIPIKETVNELNAFDIIQAGRADAILLAPPKGFSRAVNRSESVAQLLIDASNVVKARSIERYIEAITYSLVQEKQKPLIKFDIRILYNPAMRSALFMVPGVMCMIVCILSIILTSMSIAKEKEMGTFEMLISSPVKRWEIIVGKTIPFFLLGLSNIPIILAAGIIIFDLPIRGSLLALGLAAASFVFCTVCIGMLISTFANSQQQAMLGSFIFLFPAQMLAGIMFPIENMPLFLKVFAYLNPLTFFVRLARNILLKDGPWLFVMEYTGILLLLATIILFISVRRFRNTLA